LKTYDLAIIGSGPGGYVAAIRAGTLGMKTILIEKDPFLGGTCLHRGCIPTKALLHTAYLYDEIKHADEHGIEIGELRLNVKKMHARKKKIVRKLSKGIEYLMGKRNVDFVFGNGALLDAATVSVTGEKSTETYKAANIILATGSAPSQLPHIVPDGKTILNSDHILTLEEIPKSLAIIGAGAVGAEFASIFASFGCEVTLIELLPHVLPLEDEEISATIEKAFAARGIKIATATEVRKVTTAAQGANLSLLSNGETSELTAEKVLLSVGRRPVTADIGLESAGVAMERGFVKVNDYLQTGVPGIYAIGDIIPTPQLAHVASVEGILAVNHIAGKPVEPINYASNPSCTYSRPEVASVGLKEREAKEQGYDVVVGRFPFAAIGKAAILGEPEGLVKIVAEKRYDEILGVHIVGPKATELIAEAGVALNLEATVEALTRTIHAHPTLSEAMLEAAHDVYGEAIHI
jgi:dihydrolipoamide dehydrogenase